MMLVIFVSNKFKILLLSCNKVLKENREKTMDLTVLQRISWYNFVYFSLIYVLPPNDRLLCSFVITERIPTSRPLINLTLWFIPYFAVFIEQMQNRTPQGLWLNSPYITSTLTQRLRFISTSCNTSNF